MSSPHDGTDKEPSQYTLEQRQISTGQINRDATEMETGRVGQTTNRNFSKCFSICLLYSSVMEAAVYTQHAHTPE